MQLPNMRTPVDTCIELALYTEAALSALADRFSELAEFAGTLAAPRTALQRARDQRKALVEQRRERRLAVNMADVVSDEGIRDLKRTAQLAQGIERNLVDVLFPEPMSDMVRRRGASQVGEMAELAQRLGQLGETWPEAASERDKLEALRTDYQSAIEAQSALEESIRRARIDEDGAQAALVTVFDQVARSIQIRFPRNRRMQDVFFDRFRTRRSPVTDDDHGDPEPDDS